jgi:hypothetical protein
MNLPMRSLLNVSFLITYFLLFVYALISITVHVGCGFGCDGTGYRVPVIALLNLIDLTAACTMVQEPEGGVKTAIIAMPLF